MRIYLPDQCGGFLGSENAAQWLTRYRDVFAR